MIRKTGLFPVIIVILILVTGCLQETTNNDVTTTTEDSNEITLDKSYYGKWITTNKIYYAPVSAMLEDEYKEKYQNKVANYSQEIAEFNDSSVQNPIYDEKSMLKEEFYSDFRVTLDYLGIQDHQVLVIDIRNWTNPCSFFIVKDENTLIGFWDGLFFELSRQ